ncbi:hypothetical protein C2E23DRAFT_217361 [Lenzites betulinus]|nr:hypothetical protein C2E23DRAFT_217361 [Lenzites betulinus]
MPVSTSLSFLELESLLREECRISEPREFRVQHGLGRIHGKEIFLVAPPSLGKTIVIVVPMLATQELEEQANALVIVPSKILTKQQAMRKSQDATSIQRARRSGCPRHYTSRRTHSPRQENTRRLALSALDIRQSLHRRVNFRDPRLHCHPFLLVLRFLRHSTPL